MFHTEIEVCVSDDGCCPAGCNVLVIVIALRPVEMALSAMMRPVTLGLEG